MSPVEEHPFHHQWTEHHRHHPSSSNRPRQIQKLLQLRKKVTQVTPVPQKWIRILRMEQKQKIESGQPLCSDVINTAQKLRKRFQTSMDGLQQSERTPVWDEKQNQRKCGIKFEKVNSPAVQIHHNGLYHWMISIKLDGQNVMDSLSN